MKKRKISLILATFLVATSILSGCSKGTDTKQSTESEKTSKNDPVTIVWKRGKDTTPATAKLIEAFEKKYNYITVEQEDLPATSSEQHNSYTTALAAGDDSVDVITMDVVWSSEFASAGWLLPLEKYFTESKQKEFLPGPIASVKYKDSIYAVPDWTDAGVLFYRKDLVTTPPKTYDELIKISKDNIGKNGIEQGFLFQAFQNEAIVCNALEFINGNGGNILDKDGNVVIDSVKSIGGIQIMKDLIDQKVSPKGVVTYKPQDCTDQFILGNTLFMRNWPANFAALNADSSAVKGKVGIAALPTGASGTQPGSTLGGWNLAINKSSKQPDAAWKFIEFITSEEGQKINAIEGAYMPTREKIYTDSEVLAKYPQLSDLLPAFKVAKPRPVSPYYSKISDAIQVNLHKALIGETSVAVAAKDTAKQLNEIINKK